MAMTLVKDLMEYDMELIDPESSLQEAAQKMKDVSCGFLPVGRNKMPEGIITDRDIIIRAVASGKDPMKEKVSDYMTREVYSCHDGDSLEQAAKIMHENNVSRLVVLSENGQTCGIMTFGRILRSPLDREETSNVVEMATGKEA